MRALGADVSIGHLGTTDYGGWEATGTAFEKGPASGDLLRKLEIENAGDAQVISSEIDGDGPTGTLTSPEFKIEKPYISFRIGGGDYEQHACMNLLIDGKTVKSATGWNSDHLLPDAWDVRALIGKTARIQIVDNATGTWGHVNVSRVVQTDAPERMPLARQPLYQETLRPQFHFTARQWTMDRLNPGMRQEGWVNDLNGMIYYEGEYHLFAQRWHKCWIHAVSRDLVHWTELQPAFTEVKLDSGVQSGTCVIDYKNTSGLSPDPAMPPMVAFWTRADNHSHGLSYSLDHGRTWKFYDKNPILDFPERDPKVFWYAPGQHWVMMMYGSGKYHVFTSKNLLEWKNENKPVANSYECPDLFELAVDGDASRKKWVLIQGDGHYSTGTFDGIEYKEEEGGRHACDVGPNFYATQTFNNVETGDGRRIQCAWMREPNFKDMPFNQQISFPCELTLHTTGTGPRIFRQPVREIEMLQTGADEWHERVLKAGETLPLKRSGQLFRILAEVAIPEGAKLTFNLRGEAVVLTSKSMASGSPAVEVQGPIESVEILLDRASIETFVNQGELSSTRYIEPRQYGLSVKAEGGPVTIHRLRVFELRSSWVEVPQK